MKTIMSEKSVDSNFFKIKIGTLDKKNPTTMYLDAGTYITPNDYKDNYKNDIVSIEKQMKLKLKEMFKTLPAIKDDFLLVTDVAVNRISPERGTHLTVQLFFKPADYQLELKKSFKQLCDEYIQQYGKCLPVYRQIIEDQGFSCSKTK